MNSSRNASAALSGPASGGPASGGLAVGRLSLLVDCLMLPCPRRPGFTQLTRFTIQLAAALVAASLSARERKGKQIERGSILAGCRECGGNRSEIAFRRND